MVNRVLGIKQEMTQIYEGSKVTPVTIVNTEGCVVANQLKKGYEVGLGKKKNPTQAEIGKYKDLGYVPQYVVMVNTILPEGVKVGDAIAPDNFLANTITLTSRSKGKGFAGVVKRHGFAGGPKTHGQSDRLRAPGSIGAGTTPGRVLKGKRMAGRMGQDLITMRNKKIASAEGSLLLVRGVVPGAKGGLVIISVQE